MSEYLIQSETLTGIADATRYLTGDTNNLSPDAIIEKLNSIGKYQWDIVLPNYLCFTAEEANATIEIGGTENAYELDLWYSYDKTTWTQVEVGTIDSESLDVITHGTIITLPNINDKVYFKGNNPEGFSFYDYDRGEYSINKFIIDNKKVSVSGNLMTIINETGDDTALYSDCLTSLFSNSKLINAHDLILTATTLADYCYFDMFRDCTSLTSAPQLPATTVAEDCYQHMFSGCESLTIPPELPATELASGCYQYMFSGCTSLTTPPELPATELADSCYESMFSECIALTSAPELPATTLTDRCYDNMFWNCTSLTSAPQLPATTLAASCYQSMFDGCESLTTAPELPATALTNSCYYNMFSGCISLTTAPQLPATTLAGYCYEYMFRGCTSLYVSDLSGTGYDKVWKIPTNGNISGNYTMYDMFTGCLGTRSTDSPKFNGIQKTYYTQNTPV